MTQSQAGLRHTAACHGERRTLPELGMPEIGMIDGINDPWEILGKP
jgi:hypothetical protein